MSACDMDDIAKLRVPPHSIEAEQSVLGSLLLANHAWQRIEGAISEADFYRRDHRLIFGAIGGLINATKPADVITVFEQLQSLGKAEECGGLAYLNALAQSVPSASNMRHYAEIVRERSQRRALIAAADEAVDIAWDGGADMAEVTDRITSLFGALQRGHMRKGPRTMGAILAERSQHWEALEDGSADAGWATSIPALNAYLGGGLRPGCLYILGARPAVGKSSFAWQILADIAAKDLPGLFLSLEMPDGELADRAIANHGRVSHDALTTGKLDREGWTRTVAAMEALGRQPIHVDDQPALTLRDIRAKTKAVKGLKLVVVDYMQLAAGSRRDANRVYEIEEISRGLKALAKELGIAVVALSQLNRSVETRPDKRPMMSDLRDSGSIEQDADVVMLMWPVRELASEGRRIVGLHIGKNRHGRANVDVGLDFFGDTQTWQQSTADLSAAPAPKVAKRPRDFE